MFDIIRIFSTKIDGMKVYAFALLSNFGRGNSFLQFVSRELIRRCFHSLESKSILSTMETGGNYKQFDDQVTWEKYINYKTFSDNLYTQDLI